jgi:hypothetical protein
MRVLALVASALVMTTTLAPAAMAQGLNAGGLRRLPGVDALETSPVERLPDDAQAWIAEERARQKAKPGDPIELAVDIDSNIGPAIRKLAKRERVGTGDLLLVIMYAITNGAREDLEADLRRMQKAGAPDAEIQAAAALKADLDAKVEEVIQSQTAVSRTLVPQLAWSER